MLAMQYTFGLPEDNELRLVRAHVTQHGQAFDRLEGLYARVSLVSEGDPAVTSENSYAPFYLWNHGQAMTDYLVSARFKAVTAEFGWPSVKSWIQLYFSQGRAKLTKPTCATIETIDLPAHTDLNKMRDCEYKAHRLWANHPENHSGFIGLNADRWQIVRFALWTQPQKELASNVKTFKVAHLSTPGANALYANSPC